jgi:hypothetical protein
MKIGIANAAEVDHAWPHIADRLKKAQERYGSSLSSGDMWQLCRSGNAFLVLVWDDTGIRGALIMQFQTWASKRVMYCMAIVGDDVADWMASAREFISKMASDGGAESFVAEGREGWAAIFPDARKLRVTFEVKI